MLKKTECLSSCGRVKEWEKALIDAELRQKYLPKELLQLSGYSYRRVLIALYSRGYSTNHKIVLKLMNNRGLICKQRKNNKHHLYKK